MHKRSLLKLMACAPFAALPLARAAGDAWPARPVTLVVPWPPGGGTDLIARTVASKLQDRLGQPIVIENRSGASGIIGTEFVAHAAPDGYTFVLGVTNSHAINATYFKKLRYDPIRDFEPVALLATGPHILLFYRDRKCLLLG
jgi:tripartite-type tricarboxylate transporter receptor subunit TctC